MFHDFGGLNRSSPSCRSCSHLHRICNFPSGECSLSNLVFRFSIFQIFGRRDGIRKSTGNNLLCMFLFYPFLIEFVSEFLILPCMILCIVRIRDDFWISTDWMTTDPTKTCPWFSYLSPYLHFLNENVCVAQLSFRALTDPDVLLLIPWPERISHRSDGLVSGRRNHIFSGMQKRHVFKWGAIPNLLVFNWIRQATGSPDYGEGGGIQGLRCRRWRVAAGSLAVRLRAALAPKPAMRAIVPCQPNNTRAWVFRWPAIVAPGVESRRHWGRGFSAGP